MGRKYEGKTVAKDLAPVRTKGASLRSRTKLPFRREYMRGAKENGFLTIEMDTGHILATSARTITVRPVGDVTIMVVAGNDD